MRLARGKARHLWLGTFNTYRQRPCPSCLAVVGLRERGLSSRRHGSPPRPHSSLSLAPPLLQSRAPYEEPPTLDLDNEAIEPALRINSLIDGLAFFSNDALDRVVRVGIPQASDFGPWSFLLADDKALEREARFSDSSSSSLRLVDQAESEGDIRLWSCLLAFKQRRYGDDGILQIWRSIDSRRKLHDVERPAAQYLWNAILEAVLRSDDEESIRRIWDYSEWLQAAHGVQWPNLYHTTLHHTLQKRQYSKALHYHLSIYPISKPTAALFCSLLKEFANSSDEQQQRTLQAIYIFSKQRRAYDVLLPHLYQSGQHRWARKWRTLLVSYNDLPVSTTAARSFLRFIVGYHPTEPLSPEELAVAALQPNVVERAGRTIKSTLSELFNRYYGLRFGITEKGQSDWTLARWFATSWVSLNTAIEAVHTLGVTRIGPLSLQSIALREGTAERIKSRMRQLRRADIKIVRTNYTAVVMSLVRDKDDETLKELLESDIHPDVLDDINRLGDLANSFETAGDFATYRLLVSIKLALTKESRSKATNILLTTHLEAKSYDKATSLLRDMKQMKISVSNVAITAECILASVETDVDAGITLCNLLADLDFPVPARAWQSILFSLGRAGRLSDLEAVALGIATRYKAMSPMLAVHQLDLPEHMASDVRQGRTGVRAGIPADLHQSHKQHPLRLVFSDKLQSAMVRWAFRSALGQRPRLLPRVHSRVEPTGGRPKLAPPLGRGESSLLHNRRSQSLQQADEQRQPARDFYVARGVRLLRQLREFGVWVSVATVRRALLLRLAELHGGVGADPLRRFALSRRVGADLLAVTPAADTADRARANNTLSLPQLKTLCDVAWGEELLPPLDQLQLTLWQKAARSEVLRIKKIHRLRKAMSTAEESAWMRTIAVEARVESDLDQVTASEAALGARGANVH